MSTKAELQALLDRVKAATGPNYALEVDIHAMCAGAVDTPDRRAPAYTASLDAITALIERELPGAMWSACVMEEGPFAQIIRVMPDGGYVGGLTASNAATPCLALTAAFLSAMIAQMGDEHAEA